MSSPLLFDATAFALLTLLAVAVRAGFRHRWRYSLTNAGGMVMAIGIFAIASLPNLPIHGEVLARLFALQLLLLWLLIAASYVLAAWRGHFWRLHVRPALGRFAIGTWVAGSAVLAIVVQAHLPELAALAVALTVVSVLLYIPYAALCLHGYARILRHPHHYNSNGIILLATVATQSVLLAVHVNLPGLLPGALVDVIMAVDVCLFALGIVFIARKVHALPRHALADGWMNTNCIIHGALSITGLAMVQITTAPMHLMLATWTTVVVLFILVESVEIIRMANRLQRYGLRRGVLSYNASQWTRNFTFGMFYAFSLALADHAGVAAMDDARTTLLHGVTQWGQYVALALLLLELALFFSARLRLRLPRSAAASV